MDSNDPQHDDGEPTGRAGSAPPPGGARRLGRRLLGREAALARADGRGLGRTVAARHEPPEPARAVMRLVPARPGVARSPGPGPAGPAPAARPAAGPAEPGDGGGWTPSTTESTIMPGISDW